MKKDSNTVLLDDGQKIDVVKLPIGKYAELIGAFKELPKKVSSLNELNSDNLLEQLPVIIPEALPEFLSMLEIATPLKKEELEKLGLYEIVNLVMAVVKANKYKEIYELIKKATAQPITKAAGQIPA